MVASELTLPDDLVAEIDHRIIMHDVPWSHYEIIMTIKGDAPVPRVAYLEGELELMSPSRNHEAIKSVIGRLAEAYADEVNLDLCPVGSWTIRSAPKERGVEPDECYTLGDPRNKEWPDLAIEVAWTRGGIDKLEIYRGLGVGEVWVWRKGRIRVFLLQEAARYEESDRSALMPGLDLTLVARLATLPRPQAVRELKASLKRQP